MSEPNYRERLRDTILDVAREILAADGLDGLQARRLAREADCSIGTIYNLYGSLEQLTIAANAATLQELRAVLEQVDSDPGAPLSDRLERLADSYRAYATRHETKWRSVFEHRIGKEVDVPEWYRHSKRGLFRLVEDAIGAAIDNPTERAAAARTLFSAVHGVVVMDLDRRLGSNDPELAKRQLTFLVRAIAAGIDQNRP